MKSACSIQKLVTRVPGCRRLFHYALKQAAQKTILKVECSLRMLLNDELLLVKTHMKPQLSPAAVDDEKTSKNKIN